MTPDSPDQQAPELSRIEKIRTSIIAGVGRIFAGPYLPSSLIVFTILVIMTEVCFSLIGQPADYWLDYNRARGVASIQVLLLNAGPIVYVGVYFVYAALIGFVLRLLNYRPALALWLISYFYHVATISHSNVLLCSQYGRFDFSTDGLCFLFPDAVLVVFAATAGVILTRAFRPLEASALEAKAGRKIAWRTLSISVVWLTVLSVGVIWASRIPEMGWRPISVADNPKGRISGAIAYDIQRNKAIMFGGASEWLGNQWLFEHDTWEWDGTGWAQLFPPESPSGRIGHGLAYDEARGVVVVFGGYNQDGALGDTWEWDGKEWHLRCPACSPPARSGHQMIYDPQRSRVVLYGGYDWKETFFNDAWEWNGGTWRQIVFDSPSPAASSFSLVYDKGQNRTVGFLSGFSGGTWIWEASGWSRPELTLEPPRRSATGMAYDPIRGYIVLFGGTIDNQPSNDTWVFDGSTWKELRSGLRLPSRWGMSLFYDAARKRVVLFGGVENGTFHNDMWELMLPDK